MNRLVNAALIAEAAAGGKRVVVACRTPEIREVMRTAEEITPDAITRETHAHGAERVEFTSGGSIAFLRLSRGDRLPGHAPDILFLDHGQHLDDIDLATVIAATGAEVINA